MSEEEFILIGSRDIAKVASALDKALTRPEILGYMKKQVIADTIKNLATVTNEEVDELLAKWRIVHHE